MTTESKTPEEIRAAGEFRGYVARHNRGPHLRVAGDTAEWTSAGRPTMFALAAEAESRGTQARELDGTRGTAMASFFVTPAFDGQGEARFAEVDMESHYRAALEKIAALYTERPLAWEYKTATGNARAFALREAAEIARAALAVKP